MKRVEESIGKIEKGDMEGVKENLREMVLEEIEKMVENIDEKDNV